MMLEWFAYHPANGTADVPGVLVSPARMSTAWRATCWLTAWTPCVRGTAIGRPLLSVIDSIGAGA
jgi:hypothetical protein